MRAASYYSPVSNFQDRIAGIGYFRLVEELEKHFEEKKEILKENLKKLMLLIFRPENLFVSVTTDEKVIRVWKEEYPPASSAVSDSDTEQERSITICSKETKDFLPQAGTVCSGQWKLQRSRI